MKYIGSGKLKKFFDTKTTNKDVIVWGRRLKNINLSNIRSIRGNRVIYLDTIDLSSIDNMLLKLRFLLSLYKLEKMLMRFIIKNLSADYYCIHLSIIAESDAWKKLVVRDGKKTSGLTYKGVSDLAEYVIVNNLKKISANEVNKMIKNNIFDSCEIMVSPSLSLRIINNLKS